MIFTTKPSNAGGAIGAPTNAGVPKVRITTGFLKIYSWSATERANTSGVRTEKWERWYEKMAIDLTVPFQPHVLELFANEGKRSLLTNEDRYSRRGPGMAHIREHEAAAAAGWDVPLSQSLNFSFVVDSEEDETRFAMGVATGLARYLRERAMPEVDEYVIGRICGETHRDEDARRLCRANTYDEVQRGHELLDAEDVPLAGRVLLVSPDVYKILKKSPDATISYGVPSALRAKGVIALLDGTPVVNLSRRRMPQGFGFLLAHPFAVAAPVQLEELRVHRTPPGVDGDLVEGHIRYDAFVLIEKAYGLHYVPMQEGEVGA